ncbi:hypothetical protein VitviT2T_002375 [Vitis vinifera]|uniref:DnaJ-like subfamily C member 2 n=2 Tax=Vitis vinifera TaxID=29760 RepID=A0ABY9BIB1_VITVI|nr:transcription factor MAMYB [Vitis vinifera]WJZ82635.1 hypothetical protein VitviT2T_002375 [Vitis vinifera]|eukprot:XP_002279131.1 PREDICTED: dnaJ homolog subfamily C member 2-like [Vitis vinifera]
MEFLDEESRPRFVFQSGSNHSPASTHLHPQPLNKPLIFISLSLSSILISLSVFFLQSEPLKSLLLWFALSLLVGPFAPSHLTAGDIRVGRGPILEFPSQEKDSDELNKRPPSNRRPRLRKVETATFTSPVATSVEGDNGLARVEKRSEATAEESEWVDGDVEILKKQLLKHPVGMPGRWEAVAEAFRGRHGVESVIRKAKSLGERKSSDSDSFNRFLKDRKPVDKRVEDGMAMENDEKEGWSSGEDIALLNALKAFPKDVPMRWEKIAAAVPGRSKAACMKRFSELKKGFRNSKAAAEE